MAEYIQEVNASPRDMIEYKGRAGVRSDVIAPNLSPIIKDLMCNRAVVISMTIDRRLKTGSNFTMCVVPATPYQCTLKRTFAEAPNIFDLKSH